MKDNRNLKIILDRYFENYHVAKISVGGSGADLYQISTTIDQDCILKGQWPSLENEYLNYKWLEGKVPVPEVVFYEQFCGYHLLCMSKLRGKTLEDYIGLKGEKEIVTQYAGSLRLLHSLRIDASAQVQNLDARISRARYHLENRLVDPSELQAENQTTAPEELFRELLELKPSGCEPVFTHGDYCFDNIIFDGENFTGFIDLGNGGVADRYQDIALAVRNIRDTFGEHFVDLFYGEYGLSEINGQKLKFYALLDEFF